MKGRKIRDISGLRFGRLTALSFHGQAKNGYALWLCKCDCGTTKVLRSCKLLEGTTRSCGCLQRELASKNHFKHGLRSHPLYATWCSMKQRCSDQNCRGYKNYGARGIAVCERWQRSFEAFVEDMGERPSSRHSVERKDNSKGYSPDNCIWATTPEQHRNTRRTVLLELRGDKKCITDWSQTTGIKLTTLHQRLRTGWSVEKTLTTPVKSSPARNDCGI